MVEWNVKQSTPGSAGMWDSHIRLGGAVGTLQQTAQCKIGTFSTECVTAYMALHLTSTSSGYFETTWVWNADHDIDGDGTTKLTLFSARGVLSESQGPVWFIGTASEHHVMYQYALINAKNHYIGFAQTETVSVYIDDHR